MKTGPKSTCNALAVMLALALPAHAGSLWPANATRGICADHKAGAVGDLLTIVVSESAMSQSSQSTTTKRDSSIQDALQQFLFPGRGSHNGAMPSIGASGTATYAGSGDVTNSNTLSARAAVTVRDVLPNGLLVVEGIRVVTFSGETQYVVLHGVVRPEDITPDNTVASTNVADARIEFHSAGSVTDAQKAGWLTRVYDKLRPF